MNNKIARLLRKFSKETGISYRIVKSEYKKLPRNERFNFKQNAVDLLKNKSPFME